MHAWINITHPGFSGRQDMPDDGDQWVSWEQMVATLRAKGEAEGRAALLAREVVELRGEVAKLKPLEFLLLKGGDPVQRLSEAVLDLSAKVRRFEEGAQINLRQLIEAREELESERANRNRIVSAIMDDAASGRLQVLAQPPVPKLGEEVREPGFVCVQNVWLDSGEVRKAAASLGMVEAPAVVVPEPTLKQWISEVLDPAALESAKGLKFATIRYATQWFRKSVRAIPANRVLGEWKTPADHPEWPEPERDGGLTIGSDVSVRVLGWIEYWGWHSVVLREDDDTEPSRYFWEDPMDCFTPKELSERLRGWIPMPPEPNALRANQGGVAT